MSQAYNYPAGFASVSLASIGVNGSPIPTSSDLAGARDPSGNLQPLRVDVSGNLLTVGSLPAGAATAANQVLEIADLDALNARIAGALVPYKFDEVDLTYVPSGAGVGQVQTAVYKLVGSTVATLTLSYDGSDRLSSVVKS